MHTCSVAAFAGSFTVIQNPNSYPANICLLKFNNKNTGERCEICSKLTIKTPKDVKFEHVSHLLLVFLLLALNM